MRAPPPTGRAEDVERLLMTVADCARQRADIEAVALAGSWARGDPHADSDVDLVVITSDVLAYVEDSDWIDVFPGAAVMNTRSWGSLTERRLALPSGLELDIGFTTSAWASIDPVDPGTARVVGGGFRIVHDQKGLLEALVTKVSSQLR